MILGVVVNLTLLASTCYSLQWKGMDISHSLYSSDFCLSQALKEELEVNNLM
jgi:hypothetical protein